MTEFSDRPFVLGSLYGVRSFKIDRLGRLTGVNYPQVWTPGENAAKCYQDINPGLAMAQLLRAMSYGTSIGGLTATGGTPLPSERVDPGHDIGSTKHSCGFYAYFDTGANPYHKSEAQILGVVQGYGTLTVGSRGFRSQKARVLALVIPDDRLGDPVSRVRHNYGSDLVMFSSVQAALAEYPLVPPWDLPTPEADPEFWTRSAS